MRPASWQGGLGGKKDGAKRASGQERDRPLPVLSIALASAAYQDQLDDMTPVMIDEESSDGDSDEGGDESAASNVGEDPDDNSTEWSTRYDDDEPSTPRFIHPEPRTIGILGRWGMGGSFGRVAEHITITDDGQRRYWSYGAGDDQMSNRKHHIR